MQHWFAFWYIKHIYKLFNHIKSNPVKLVVLKHTLEIQAYMSVNLHDYTLVIIRHIYKHIIHVKTLPRE